MLQSFCFRCGGSGAGVGVGGGENLVLYPTTMYSFKSEIQRHSTMFNMRSFVLVIKNNEAVLVLK